MSKHSDTHEHDAAASAFKVVDRRRFTPEGEPRQAPSTESDSTRQATVLINKDTPQAKPQTPPQQAAKRTTSPEAAQTSAPSEVDFLAFIGSLATSAMAAMGLLPPEQSRGMPKNMAMAREYIEIIAMLKDKTVGNLTPQEDRAMQSLVSELRLQYVEMTQHPAPKSVS